MHDHANVASAMERSRDVLETLKAVKGEVYQKRIYVWGVFTQVAHSAGMPDFAIASILAAMVESWGLDHKKPEDQEKVKEMTRDVDAYLKSVELRP